MNFHLAPVGLGHVHPQLLAAGLAGTVQTGHIVAVVVFLRYPRQSPQEGEETACWQPPSAPPPSRRLDRESTVLPDHSPEELVLAWEPLACRWPWRAQYLPPSYAPNSSAPAKSMPAIPVLHSAIPRTGQGAFPGALSSAPHYLTPAPEHTQGRAQLGV